MHFTNSITATQAHKLFCLSRAHKFADYSENLWGISSSDYPGGFVVWGGPPAIGPIDPAIVPSAAAGSIPFLPRDMLALLQPIRNRFPAAWTRYGFADSLNPLTGWYATHVVGITAGIFVLMAENYQTSSSGKRSSRVPE